MRAHEVVVEGLPAWLDAARLLGDGAWRFQARPDGTVQALAKLDTTQAADVAARLRGLGLGGKKLAVHVVPALPRDAVRDARTRDARRRRETTPGFLRRGTQLDDEARFSLTPEALAEALAAELYASGARSVLDLCAGAGGNAIAFARAGLRVTSVERDFARLAMLAHNARVYDVDARITQLCGDALDAARTREADIVFIDPPWGGDYDRACVTLDALPLLAAVLDAVRARGLGEGGAFQRLIAKVPPSFDVESVLGAEARGEYDAANTAPRAGHCTARAIFGAATGDAQRVKFVLLTLRG